MTSNIYVIVIQTKKMVLNHQYTLHNVYIVYGYPRSLRRTKALSQIMGNSKSRTLQNNRDLPSVQKDVYNNYIQEQETNHENMLPKVDFRCKHPTVFCEVFFSSVTFSLILTPALQ